MLVLFGGCAAVVSVQQFHVVGIRSQHGQRLDVFREGQHAFVLEQHHRLAGGLGGRCVVLLAADDILTKLCPRQTVGGVEHTQFEAAHQRLAQMLVEHVLLDEAFFESFGEAHEHLSAFQVGTVQHGVDRCRKSVFMSLMLSAVKEIVDGIAVGEHNGVVAPFVAQDVDEQAVAGAAGLALEALVGAHHLAHVGFLHQRLEGGQIGLPKVAVRRVHVHRVAQGLWSAMHGIVLRTGVGLEVIGIVTLHA